MQMPGMNFQTRSSG
ncbi:hypothetical protein [Otoolea muris]